MLVARAVVLGLSIAVGISAGVTREVGLQEVVVQRDDWLDLEGITQSPSDTFKNATDTIANEAQIFLTTYEELIYFTAIPVGLLLTFLGLALLRPSLFLAGFVLGSLGSFHVANVVFPPENGHHLSWPSVLTSAVVGLLIGYLTLRMLSFGIFLAGASLGFLLALTFQPFIMAKEIALLPEFQEGASNSLPADLEPTLLFYAIAAAIGVLGGALALVLERILVVLASSIGGSFAALSGALHFHSPGPYEKLHGLNSLWKLPEAQVAGSPEREAMITWTALWVVISVMGILVQFGYTGKRTTIHGEEGFARPTFPSHIRKLRFAARRPAFAH